MNLKTQISKMDMGRFELLAEAMDVKDICAKCYSFNSSVGDRQAYRCACIPSCIGVTLSPRAKKYILERIDFKALENE